MFGFFKNLSRKTVSFEHLQIMQMIAQQVVLSVEHSVRIPGPAKKAMALKLTAAILKEVGVVAPDSAMDTAIEASVQMMKLLGRELRKNPYPNLDIKRRPAPQGTP